MRKHAITAGWLCAAIALAACSGGQNSTPPVSTPLSSSRAPQSSARDTTPIQYDVSPSYKLAVAASGPAALPPPSQCAALFGFTCYTPALIRSAYDVPSSAKGAGQTIVIVDAYGSPTIRNDLHVFDQAFGLPDPTLNIIYPGGKPTYNPLQNHHELNWAAETSLDVEWSHAIAPLATIDLVIASNNGGDVLNLAQNYVVSHHLGNVMSLSFGSPEAAIHGLGNNLQLQQAHAVYAAAQQAGISVFVSAGDSGASNGLATANAAFPASDPLVTSVGGTDLFMSDAGAYQSETAWNDSNPSLCPFGCKSGAVGATGGAPSKVFAAPAYQAGLSGFATRTTADVGYNASLYTGILTFLSFRGLTPGFYFSGGTSEGAPQWAAIGALADESAGRSLGLLNPKLYAIRVSSRYATDFHDVTVGDNGFFGPGFPAGTGYDLPTGIGSPDVANLISDLAK
ncbi:MAG: S53 family peptidase [Vulcanimicrobiaceae bacterium]